MQATAPNAKVKQILTYVVTVLKFYSSTKSLPQMIAYQNAHRKQFQADTSALASALKSCI